MTIASSPNKSFTLSGFLTGDKPAGFLLSLVAGFVDTAAFIILFGIFTAHVTGNIALAGSSIVGDDEESVFTRLITLPAFMITVAMTSLLARYARRKGWPVFAVLLTAEAIALVVFLIVGATLSPALLLDVQEEYILPIALSGIVAMGIQNTLMKEAKGTFKSYIPTTVMTGNTTQLTIDLVQLIGSKFSSGDEAEQEAQESVERISRYVPVIAGFALGGGAAALFILASETWWTLIMPLVIVTVLAIAAYAEHNRNPSVSQ
ncbi:MAG: YoaK family protein [Cyanobacteria bacterium J06627_32]